MKYFGLWFNSDTGFTFSIRNALGGNFQSIRVSRKEWYRPTSVNNYNPNDHRHNRFIGPEVLIEWGKDEVSTS